jgi:thioredoxin-like negative regulator of GroEL
MRLLAVGIVLLAAAAGFSLLLVGRESGAAADVRVIAHGEEVDLASHAVSGKHTVFDFYAVWCPPCRVLGPALERLAASHPDRLAIRKVDIVDWTMPVAAQHGIQELPFLVLYDPQGREAARGDAVFEALDRLFGPSARETLGEGVETEPAPAGGAGPDVI